MRRPEDRRAGVLRAGWFALGCLLVALGLIGVVVPLMPTTVFLIFAAACFARSSPRLEAWLLNHPRFGPALCAWREERAISRRAKIAACIGMTAGFIVFVVAAHPHLALALGVAAMLGLTGAWIVFRPAPGRGQG